MAFSLDFLSDFAKAAMEPIPHQVDKLLGAALGGGTGGAAGSTYSTAESEAEANSYSQSWGNRDIASTMLQNIGETTHQAAHSSRSKRATVVKEVSQSEHESISTRVLTNYNHMHALTVQYYEVLQVYRVETKLTRAERCIYVPVKLIDFTSRETLDQFRPILARDPDLMRALSAEITDRVVELRPEPVRRDPRPQPPEEMVRGPVTRPVGGDPVRPAPGPALDPERALGRLGNGAFVTRAIGGAPQWDRGEASRLAAVLRQPVTRAGSRSAYLPAAAELTAVSIRGRVQEPSVQIKLVTGEVLGSVERAIPLAQIAEVSVSGGPDSTSQVDVQLMVQRDGIELPLSVREVPMRGVERVRVIGASQAPRTTPQEVQAILQTKRLAYTQQVLRTLGNHGITSLLSRYYITARARGDGRPGARERRIPLIQIVDPKPLGFHGNYIAFKLSASSELEGYDAWVEGLNERGIQVGSSRQELVPLASGGVFAEAVLGRANAAEKLDVTRFWNWQDSPIPIQAPEIAAIQSGSRATAEDTKPSAFAAPVVSIVQPQAMPDPTGTAAVLAAVQNGSMFRDMSGLAATIQAGSSALLASAQGASTAGQQAGGNMAAYLQSEVEKMRIAAQMISSLAGTAASVFTGKPVGGSGIGPGTPISNVGAATNYFDKAIGRTDFNGAAGSGSSPSVNTPGASGGGSGVSTGAGLVPGGGASGRGGSLPPDHPMNAETWGSTGQPQGSLVQSLADRFSGGSSATTVKASPWTYLVRTTVFDRVKALMAQPDTLDQGALGVCGEAAFFRAVIKRDPGKFQDFASALYSDGIGLLGALKVAPDNDLLRANYPKIAARVLKEKKYPPMPQQADWMVTSALRDTTNWVWDFEGEPEDSWALESYQGELKKWLEKTGIYKSVTVFEGKTADEYVAASAAAPGADVFWSIDITLIEPNITGGHLVALDSGFTKDGAGTVTAPYWSWAQHYTSQHTSEEFTAKTRYIMVAAV